MFVKVYRMGVKFWVKGFRAQLTKKISASISLGDFKGHSHKIAVINRIGGKMTQIVQKSSSNFL